MIYQQAVLLKTINKKAFSLDPMITNPQALVKEYRSAEGNEYYDAKLVALS